MKKIASACLLVMFCFMTSAQISKKEIESNLVSIYETSNREKEIIRKNRIGKYDDDKLKSLSDSEKKALEVKWEKDYILYLQDIKPLNTQRLQQLQNLIVTIEKSRPLIGRRKIQGGAAKSEVKEYEITEDGVKIRSASSVEINELRKAFSDAFRTDFIDSEEGILRSSITLIVDTDGSLKNLKAKGSNEEFNALVIIILYSLDKKMKPSEDGDDYVPTRYQLPVAMNFE